MRGTLIYPWDSIPLLFDPKQSGNTSLTVISIVINMYLITNPRTPLAPHKDSQSCYSLVNLLLVSLLFKVEVRVDGESEGRQISGSDYHFHLQSHHLLVLMQGDDIQTHILHQCPAHDTDRAGRRRCWCYPHRAERTAHTSCLPSSLSRGVVRSTSSVR